MYIFYSKEEIDDLIKESNSKVVVFATLRDDYKKEYKEVIKVPIFRIKENIPFSDKEDEYAMVKDCLAAILKIPDEQNILIPESFDCNMLSISPKIHLLINHFYKKVRESMGELNSDELSLMEIMKKKEMQLIIELFKPKKIKLHTNFIKKGKN